MAANMPGPSLWRRSHEAKAPFDRFCEALKIERANHHAVFGVRGDTARRHVYACTYGHHHLIIAPLHWHVGRPMC